MCGIKLELARPAAERPEQGVIVPNVTLPPMCSPAFKAGPPSPEAQTLSAFVKDVLNCSQCIELDTLCPVPGKYAWVVYVDLLCLDHDGNLRDAVVAALMGALASVKLPTVEYDADLDELSVKPGGIKEMIKISNSFDRNGTRPGLL